MKALLRVRLEMLRSIWSQEILARLLQYLDSANLQEFCILFFVFPLDGEVNLNYRTEFGFVLHK